MALFDHINSRAKTTSNSGFGNNSANAGSRFMNKNGQPNVVKKGLQLFEGVSLYHTMLQMPRWKFLCLLLGFYISINFVFAVIYLAIGIQHLEGIIAHNPLEKFGEAYFFSAQTFTTVGYGRISPKGFASSTVASIEALIGLLSFAIATGLFYGRFSRPKAYIRFSEQAVLAPFKDGLALMFRVATFKNNNLLDAEVKVNAAIVTQQNTGQFKNTFYPLELELERVNTLSLSWTIVHPINESSPFYKFTQADFENTDGELLIFLKAFDDMFSNTVTARSSYTLNEVVIGAKFLPMYYDDASKQKTILDLAKLNLHAPVDIQQHWNNKQPDASTL